MQYIDISMFTINSTVPLLTPFYKPLNPCEYTVMKWVVKNCNTQGILETHKITACLSLKWMEKAEFP